MLAFFGLLGLGNSVFAYKISTGPASPSYFITHQTSETVNDFSISLCRIVTNNNVPLLGNNNDLFVPVKSQVEWQSLVNNGAPGVSLANCTGTPPAGCTTESCGATAPNGDTCHQAGESCAPSCNSSTTCCDSYATNEGSALPCSYPAGNCDGKSCGEAGRYSGTCGSVCDSTSCSGYTTAACAAGCTTEKCGATAPNGDTCHQAGESCGSTLAGCTTEKCGETAPNGDTCHQAGESCGSTLAGCTTEKCGATAPNGDTCHQAGESCGSTLAGCTTESCGATAPNGDICHQAGESCGSTLAGCTTEKCGAKAPNGDTCGSASDAGCSTGGPSGGTDCTGTEEEVCDFYGYVMDCSEGDLDSDSAGNAICTTWEQSCQEGSYNSGSYCYDDETDELLGLATWTLTIVGSPESTRECVQSHLVCI